MKHLSLGFSPCPNDTFIFDALVHSKIDKRFTFDVSLADVEQLNNWAFQSKLDITKISFHAWSYLTNEYQMLNSGAALGFGVGPLLISKKPIDDREMESAKIAIPGKWTTANFLMTNKYPKSLNKVEMLFSDIEEAVANGTCDAGVIIHENRFTYHERGLHLIQDLGKAWEDQTGLAIPLGGIAIKRNIPNETKQEIASLIRQSIEHSIKFPSSPVDYIKMHAQEMDPEVVQKHIDLYVNQYSLDLQQAGHQAIDEMLSILLRNNLISEVNANPILI